MENLFIKPAQAVKLPSDQLQALIAELQQKLSLTTLQLEQESNLMVHEYNCHRYRWAQLQSLETVISATQGDKYWQKIFASQAFREDVLNWYNRDGDIDHPVLPNEEGKYHGEAA